MKSCEIWNKSEIILGWAEKKILFVGEQADFMLN